jgi:Tfp pilus assembly PilM family ATPase
MTRALPLGVDLGRARLCVALAERGSDGIPRLIAAVSKPTGENAAATLAAVRSELGTRERRCVLALAAPDSLAREVTFPPLGRRERERAARFEAARFVPYALDEMVVRLLPLAAGRQAVAVARRVALEQALQVTRRAGLRTIAVDDAAFALLRAFDADVIVDVGLGGSTCVVRDEPLPAVRVLTLGGQALTDGIVAALGIDGVTAEQRKRGIGLAGAGEPVRDALLDQIAAALVEARTTIPRELTGVVLTGNGARLPGLAAAVERAIAIPTRLGTLPPQACSVLPADVVRAAAPDWGLAYGLALWEYAA